jgi:hypothetical protein
MNVTRRNALASAAALSMLPPAARADANTDIDVVKKGSEQI